MLAITTMSPEGYDQYGRTCLYGLQAYWPGRIVAYMEAPQDAIPDRVEFRYLNSIHGWTEWLDRAKKHAGSDGQSHDGYDFRYNAQKYCRKVFAQDAVFDEDEYVWWVDADCVIKQKIPLEVLENPLHNVVVAYMGRRGAQSYTETGLVGFNTKHEDFAKFRASYLPWVKSGMIFSQLKGWHDCIAFDHARQGVAGNNMTPRAQNMDQTIQDTPFGRYIAHLKGPRKFSDKHKRDALAV